MRTLFSCSAIDIINCIFYAIAALGSVGACIVAWVSIHLGFKNQSRNKVLDAIQHFYLRLKSNLELLNYYFEGKKKPECILTFFCNNEAVACTHKLIDRIGFEKIREQIVKLLSDNDFNLYERQLGECDIEYDITDLNNNIQSILKTLMLLAGGVPIDGMRDKEYFPERPIYFVGNEQQNSDDMAYETSKKINMQIKKVITGIDDLTKRYFNKS